MPQLASPIRDDSVPSHDYLRIAVEFDNGRDITYCWSSCLAPGSDSNCSLPDFKVKEYHVFIRSGEQVLACW